MTFAALVLAGCSSDSDNTPTVNLPVCENVSGFTVAQQGEFVDVQLSGTNEPLNYELSVVPAGGSGGPENGYIYPFTETSKRWTATELNILPGYTYYIYVRSACSDSFKSNWTAAQALSFEDYCQGPTNLVFAYHGDGFGFGWTYTDEQTSHFQVSYGPQGTAAGAGILVQTNSDHIAPALEGGATYDFYVRSFCSGGTGWSAWSGPYTYFAETDLNMCTQPSNVQYTQLSASQANFTWDYNGQTQFEYALVSGSQSINTATIYEIGIFGTPTFTGMSNWAQYTFYVRAVCADGARTPWTTILVDLN
ncbi:hypothetical protein [Flavobacterium caeni]|uniref:Fibronectin type-III domain-containing protein n=1 Tax=Flavobacterium caeni TaxID=490189 RepID=A0A1G5DXW5_9FLAO|nr:hypothetical protein [Flavobacterium caeni]SCY19360.1 hypothetical protein SAMN02927903_00869 [Flavobacterium caeni]